MTVDLFRIYSPRMKRITGALTAAIVSAGALGAGAAHADLALGPASGYNVFSVGSASFSNSDIWGETAVGGNASFSNYGLGTHLDNTYNNLVTTDIGGNVSFTNTQSYHGNIDVGGTKTGSVTLQNGGTLTTGSQPINFTSAQTTLQQTAASYFSMATNGTTTDSFGTVTFTGTKAVNVFQISGSDLSAANTIKFNVTAGSTIIVNVGGSSVTSYSIPNVGFFYNGATLQPTNDSSQVNDVENILFNFPYATTLGFNTAEGSVLAPSAAVSFTNGHIDGNLIAGSLSGTTTGESHSFLYNGIGPAGSPSTVPEPNQAGVLGLGLLGLMAMRIARRKSA